MIQFIKKIFILQIVAPFSGFAKLGNNMNEVIIEATGGFLRDIDIVIKNIRPNIDILHPNDLLYIRHRVSLFYNNIQ